MTEGGFHARAHRAWRRWWLIATALLVVGALCFGVGLHDHLSSSDGSASPPFTPSSAGTPSSTGTPASGSSVSAKSTVSPRAVEPPAVARSVPVRLRIPAIGVAVSLSQLGLNPDRTVQVPTNFAEPGWFHLGPSPGQVGSAVILGHVHSRQGPAVFWRLGKLRAGDRIEVRLADGVVARFSVIKVAAYPKNEFPSRLVYASHGYSALQLVTCGGLYDKRNHRYLSNVVVYATLVSTTSAAA
jgi:LPXTG-site transpeptidase (sortase) family protein